MLHGQEERTYQRGDMICHEHERPDGLFIIKDGLVEIFQTIEIDGKPAEIILGKIGTRAILGEMGIIDHQPRSASARALSPATLVFVSRSAFQQHLQQMPPWVAILIRTIVQRLRETNRRLAEALEHTSNAPAMTPAADIVLSHGDEEGDALLRALDRNRPNQAG